MWFCFVLFAIYTACNREEERKENVEKKSVGYDNEKLNKY